MTSPADKFPIALAQLLGDEGGVSRVRSDSAAAVVAPGQAHTNLGISLRAVRDFDADGHLPEFLRKVLDVDNDGDIDADDVEGWTPEIAGQFYRRMYWEPAQCNLMPWPLAYLVFDLAVNAGKAQALRTLQRALDVAADGIPGPKTRTAIARLTVGSTALRRDRMDDAVRAFTVHKLEFYRLNKTAEANFRGWAARSIDVLLFCLMEA